MHRGRPAQHLLGGRLACDDEPFCLELATDGPHVAYELRRSCPLDAARAHLAECGVPAEERVGGLLVHDPDGNGVLLLPYRATELAGVELPAGSKVTTWFVSGNRDETVFEDPDTFDVGRTPNRHMAFGPGGIHLCMGSHLARMEVKIAFEELLKRVSSIELTAPPERLRSNFFNGIKRLPVRVTR